MRAVAKSAMTLVELVVALLVFSVLSVAFWGVWIGGNRSFEDSSAQAAAMRSASLAIEHVRRDLARIAVPRPRPPFDSLPQPVRMLPGGELEIALVPTLPDGELKSWTTSLATAAVIYEFHPGPGPNRGLHRNGRRLAGIELERFEAELVSDPISQAPFVRLTVVGAELGGRKTVLFQDLVYLQQLDQLRRHPTSVPNPVPALAPAGPPDPNTT